MGDDQKRTGLAHESGRVCIFFGRLVQIMCAPCARWSVTNRHEQAGPAAASHGARPEAPTRPKLFGILGTCSTGALQSVRGPRLVARSGTKPAIEFCRRHIKKCTEAPQKRAGHLFKTNFELFYLVLFQSGGNRKRCLTYTLGTSNVAKPGPDMTVDLGLIRLQGLPSQFHFRARPSKCGNLWIYIHALVVLVAHAEC